MALFQRKEGREGRGDKNEVLMAQPPTVAFYATWWHQFHRFSVLSIILVKRLWDPCLHGLPLPRTVSADGESPDSDDKPELPQVLSISCTGTQESHLGLLLVLSETKASLSAHGHPFLPLPLTKAKRWAGRLTVLTTARKQPVKFVQCTVLRTHIHLHLHAAPSSEAGVCSDLRFYRGRL